MGIKASVTMNLLPRPVGRGTGAGRESKDDIKDSLVRGLAQVIGRKGELSVCVCVHALFSSPFPSIWFSSILNKCLHLVSHPSVAWREALQNRVGLVFKGSF